MLNRLMLLAMLSLNGVLKRRFVSNGLSLHAAALLRALISTSYSHLEARWILLGLPKPQNNKCSQMVEFLLNSLLSKSSLEGVKEHPTLAPNTPQLIIPPN